MGKLVSFIIILIIIDILFLITGQLTLDSSTSIIIQSIKDPSAITKLNFWTVLITGLSVLGATAAVFAGFVTKSSDVVIFIIMSTALSLMIGDFVNIYNELASFNKPLATIIMAPILIIFALIIVEWAKNKD